MSRYFIDFLPEKIYVSVSKLLLEALVDLKRGRKDIKAFKGMHHYPDWKHKISTSALRFTLYINIEP